MVITIAVVAAVLAALGATYELKRRRRRRADQTAALLRRLKVSEPPRRTKRVTKPRLLAHTGAFRKAR